MKVRTHPSSLSPMIVTVRRVIVPLNQGPGLRDCEPLTFITGTLHRQTHTRSQHTARDFQRLLKMILGWAPSPLFTVQYVQLCFYLSLAFQRSEWNSFGPVIRRHQLLSWPLGLLQMWFRVWVSMSPFHRVTNAIFIHSRTADAFSSCDYFNAWWTDA